MGAFDLGSVRLTKDAISANVVVLYGSSKPGNRSFGYFSRPLLEGKNDQVIPPQDNICGGGLYD